MSEITQLLNELKTTEPSEEAFGLIYQELRRLAAFRLRSGMSNAVLQPTVLVHETYMRLMNRDATWENRGHFYAVASEVMRRIIADHYRRMGRQKRGAGFLKIEVNIDHLPAGQKTVDMLEINEAISALESIDPQKALLVKLRFFVGMTMEEVADVLEVSIITAERYWRYSRAFLAKHLQKGLQDDGQGGR